MTSSALLLIDAQVNMFNPASPVGSADLLLARLIALVKNARAAHILIVFVRNGGGPGEPDERGTPGWELHPALGPMAGELVLDKTTSDTFESTPLHDELKARRIGRLVVTGLQSEYCVTKTTVGALARGYEVTLVKDGHSTYDDRGRSALEISAAVNAELEGRVQLASTADIRFR
jgi:nicotinamidase-related amidase